MVKDLPKRSSELKATENKLSFAKSYGEQALLPKSYGEQA